MCRKDSVLNALQCLICDKTKPNQTKFVFDIYIQKGFGIK